MIAAGARSGRSASLASSAANMRAATRESMRGFRSSAAGDVRARRERYGAATCGPLDRALSRQVRPTRSPLSAKTFLVDHFRPPLERSTRGRSTATMNGARIRWQKLLTAAGCASFKGSAFRCAASAWPRATATSSWPSRRCCRPASDRPEQHLVYAEDARSRGTPGEATIEVSPHRAQLATARQGLEQVRRSGGIASPTRGNRQLFGSAIPTPPCGGSS